jgi:hypothetical protein
VSNNPEEFNDVTIGEIKVPRLSVCLSGTPSQAPSLLRGAENGLFSRFLFYIYGSENEPEFKDVFAKEEIVNLDDYFNQLAENVLNMYDEVNKAVSVNFSISAGQQNLFRSQFNKYLKKLNNEFRDETRGIIFRLGLITFRIAMLLTIIRSLEEGNLRPEIECNDRDFQIAMILSDVYLEHSLAVLQSMPSAKRFNYKALKLLQHLPGEFSYSEAISTGTANLGFSERSVSYYLKELVQKQSLLKATDGMYIKC